MEGELASMRPLFARPSSTASKRTTPGRRPLTNLVQLTASTRRRKRRSRSRSFTKDNPTTGIFQNALQNALLRYDGAKGTTTPSTTPDIPINTTPEIKEMAKQVPSKLKTMRLNRAALALKGIQPTQKKFATVLKAACRDPTRCIAFGQYREMFNKLFHHFNYDNWSHIDEAQMSRVGGASRNGFAVKIPFVKNEYTAHTILKSAVFNDSDNLMYEYEVGTKFINQQCAKFPCFLETYGLYKYKSDGALSAMQTSMDKNGPTLPRFPIRDLLGPATVDWVQSCGNSKQYSVLIQYFDQVKSFRDIVNNHYEDSKYDIFQLLYQVYYVLDVIKDVYTHYDLHGENVLLYKPFSGNTYVKMHYHQLDGSVVTIYSEWIVKLIDYGRNYFKTDTHSSTAIINDICNTRQCMIPDAKNGLTIIKGSRDLPLVADIDPTTANPSHDLQLLKEKETIGYLKNYKIQIQQPTTIRQFGSDYKPSILPNDLSNVTWTSNVGQIVNTVTDVRRLFDSCPPYRDIMDKNYIRKYATWRCGGEMHIYPDGRPYTFELHPEPANNASSTVTPLAATAIPATVNPRRVKTLDIYEMMNKLKKHIPENKIIPILKGVIRWMNDILIFRDCTDKYKLVLTYYLFFYSIQSSSAVLTSDILELYAGACLQIVSGTEEHEIDELVSITVPKKHLTITFDSFKRFYANAQFEMDVGHKSFLLDATPLKLSTIGQASSDIFNNIIHMPRLI